MYISMDTTNEIWFFSGTGQGKLLAKELKKRLNQYNVFDLTSSSSRIRKCKIVKNSNIVVIFPIYASSVPRPLLEFFQNIQGENSYCVVIALWGSAHKEGAISLATNVLTNRGFKVVGAAELVANHSCLISEKIKEIPLEQVEKVANSIRNAFKNKKEISVSSGKDKLIVRVLSSVPNSGVIKAVTKWNYHSDACKQCNICINQCPVGAISQTYSIDNKKCIRCFACATNCPSNAIDIHVSKIAKRALEHHQRERQKDVFY